MKSQPSLPPKLAAPGAGIPRLERFIANRMIRRKAAATSRTESAALFENQRAMILKRLEVPDDRQLSMPVLIKRLRGLEDSSRYWSLLMVVDHLRIVNRDITEVIAELGAGRVPPGKVSTADVKPSAEVTHAVIAEFDMGCHAFAKTVASIPDLNTVATFPHPWFGEMDAATWHFMTGFHMQLHLKQIDQILAGLNAF